MLRRVTNCQIRRFVGQVGEVVIHPATKRSTVDHRVGRLYKLRFADGEEAVLLPGQDVPDSDRG